MRGTAEFPVETAFLRTLPADVKTQLGFGAVRTSKPMADTTTPGDRASRGFTATTGERSPAIWLGDTGEDGPELDLTKEDPEVENETGAEPDDDPVAADDELPMNNVANVSQWERLTGASKKQLMEMA